MAFVTKKPVKAAFALLLATSFWGASYLLMKVLGDKQQALLPGAGSWFLSSLSSLIRFGVSAVILVLWSRRHLRTITSLEFRQGLGIGLFGGAGILFQMDGVMHTAASTAAFLTQCYCLFIPLALVIHRRKLPDQTMVLSCVMVMAGVAVLANVDWHRLRMGRGEAESVLASVFFTGQILWLERPVYHRNRSTLTTLIMFMVITVMVLPLVWLTGNGAREWVVAYNSWPNILLIVVLTLAATLAAYSIMNYWQPHVPATQAGLIYCCEPIFTSLYALFLPGILSAAIHIHYANETLGTRTFIGGGLITAANLLAIWHAKLQLSPPRPATDRAG